MEKTRPISSPLPVFKQLQTHHDPENGVAWLYMDPNERPCFSLTLLHSMRNFLQCLADQDSKNLRPARDLHYVILASKQSGVFNLGGDLDLFLKLIRKKDKNAISQYANLCVDIVFRLSTHLRLPLTTIALVQGDALGGGFEAALSCQVIIAEKSSKLGLPEILFNLFPGMGAYSFLARRLGPREAEKLMVSGKVYTASELADLGVIDVVADDGKGVNALHDFMRSHSKKQNAMQGIMDARDRYNPITHEELNDIANIWVDAALQLGAKDLRTMERLVRAQNQRSKLTPPVNQTLSA
ncbi:MAG: crotonase/enoyl-CoA hydratase family protein [Gammaproteobacteria bacterium]|nr:crotonase/enoyl-CoA hydratase family protein [Gammaproteobacteria bacterium]